MEYLKIIQSITSIVVIILGVQYIRKNRKK